MAKHVCMCCRCEIGCDAPDAQELPPCALISEEEIKKWENNPIHCAKCGKMAL